MKKTETCWLCGRPLGVKIERHHPLPRSLGGRETVSMHPICHRKIHQVFGRKDLKGINETAEGLRQNPELRTFLKWLENKPPDFYKPTRSKNKKRF